MLDFVQLLWFLVAEKVESNQNIYMILHWILWAHKYSAVISQNLLTPLEWKKMLIKLQTHQGKWPAMQTNGKGKIIC